MLLFWLYEKNRTSHYSPGGANTLFRIFLYLFL